MSAETHRNIEPKAAVECKVFDWMDTACGRLEKCLHAWTPEATRGAAWPRTVALNIHPPQSCCGLCFSPYHHHSTLLTSLPDHFVLLHHRSHAFARRAPYTLLRHSPDPSLTPPRRWPKSVASSSSLATVPAERLVCSCTPPCRCHPSP